MKEKWKKALVFPAKDVTVQKKKGGELSHEGVQVKRKQLGGCGSSRTRQWKSIGRVLACAEGSNVGSRSPWPQHTTELSCHLPASRPAMVIVIPCPESSGVIWQLGWVLYLPMGTASTALWPAPAHAAALAQPPLPGLPPHCSFPSPCRSHASHAEAMLQKVPCKYFLK